VTTLERNCRGRAGGVSTWVGAADSLALLRTVRLPPPLPPPQKTNSLCCS
jgi:hypothetical protein